MKQRKSGASFFALLRTFLVLAFVLTAGIETVAQAPDAVRPETPKIPHVERLDGLPRTPEQMQQVHQYEWLASMIAGDRRDSLDTNWSSTFSISRNEGQVLAIVLLDAFDYGATLDKQMEPHCAHSTLPDEAQSCQRLIDERFLRYEASVYRLWQQLGATDFAKVEHWLGIYARPRRQLGRPLYDRNSPSPQSPTGASSDHPAIATLHETAYLKSLICRVK